MRWCIKYKEYLMATQFWAWNDLKAAMNANPGKLVVIDKRTDTSNPNLNNGQPFTTIEQLKNYLNFEVMTTDVHGPGGDWTSLQKGEWGWELVGFVVHTTASILWAYCIKDNGDLYDKDLVVFWSYQGHAAAPSDLLVKPDYAINPREGEYQYSKDKGEFNFTFNNQNYVGADHKGPFHFWPLIAANPGSTDVRGTMGIRYLGAWGGTHYDEASPIFMLRQKGSNGDNPPPTGKAYLELVVDGASYGKLMFVTTNDGSAYIRVVDETGKEYGRLIFQ